MSHEPQPLAALLASHPEECAAVVAVLCAEGYDGSTAQGCVDDMRTYRSTPLDLAMVERVLSALAGAGLAHRYNKTEWRLSGSTWRYAIARMGAAAWLSARCPTAPASTNPLNLGAIRLCALASEGARIGAIYRAAFAIGGTFPRNAAEYRARLLEVERVSMGLPVAALDVDAEVAAVWGAGAPAKGEQR